MILEPPASVQKLQMALQAKAKEAPGYRFYLLYDKVYRKDVLDYAYRCCRANRGAPGVDSQDFVDIEAYGQERWLANWRTNSAERRIERRQYGVCGYPRRMARSCAARYSLYSRSVVMTAAVAVMSPIFEVDMPSEQHAYRANFSAHTAVRSCTA